MCPLFDQLGTVQLAKWFAARPALLLKTDWYASSSFCHGMSEANFTHSLSGLSDVPGRNQTIRKIVERQYADKPWINPPLRDDKCKGNCQKQEIPLHSLYDSNGTVPMKTRHLQILVNPLLSLICHYSIPS